MYEDQLDYIVLLLSGGTIERFNINCFTASNAVALAASLSNTEIWTEAIVTPTNPKSGEVLRFTMTPPTSMWRVEQV